MTRLTAAMLRAIAQISAAGLLPYTIRYSRADGCLAGRFLCLPLILRGDQIGR